MNSPDRNSTDKNEIRDKEAPDQEPPFSDNAPTGSRPSQLPAVRHDLSPEELDQLATQVSAQVIDHMSAQAIRASFFAGPLPPPETLEHYDHLYPGAAEQLFTELKIESHHRRELESRLVKHDVLQVYFGQVFAFTLVLAAIVLAAIAVFRDYDIAGVILGIASLATLVGVFIYRGRQQSGNQGDHKSNSESE